MALLFSVRVQHDHLVKKSRSFGFPVRVFHERLSVYVFVSFHFDFD